VDVKDQRGGVIWVFAGKNLRYNSNQRGNSVEGAVRVRKGKKQTRGGKGLKEKPGTGQGGRFREQSLGGLSPYNKDRPAPGQQKRD